MEDVQRDYSHCHTQGVNLCVKPRGKSIEPEMAVVGYTLRGKGSESLEDHTLTRVRSDESSILALILSAKAQDNQGPYQDTTKVSKIEGLGFYFRQPKLTIGGR